MKLNGYGRPALLLALLVPPAATRWDLLEQLDVQTSRLDFGGFSSDLLTALLLFLLLTHLLPRMKVVAGLLVLAVAVVHHANYEHVIALGGSASYAHASQLLDPTFLRGSGLAPSNPTLLAAVILLPLVLVTYAATAGATGVLPRTAIPVAVIVVGAHIALPYDAVALSWRQTNVLAENVHWLAVRAWGASDDASLALNDQERARVETARALDLEAMVAFPAADAERNVLLVILEGVSGAYLERVRSAHGFESTIDMPRLNQLAGEGLVYRTFLTNQRQTNRGEYALLCGDYPVLLTREPKMSRFDSTRGPDSAGGVCLPEAMRRLGYRTAYLQAAPLAYMGKDRFLPAIGFDQTLGADWFENVPTRALWGVEDRAFFEHSVTLLESLVQREEKWFLTLLNVGTHHPYAVPDETSGRYRDASLDEAIRYLDDAFADFMHTLEQRKLLDDTLVLITSDESAGLPGETGPGLAARLAANWGILIALSPSGERAEIDAPFMQVDLQASVLDRLGAEPVHATTGRSVFRSYPEPRTMLFANTHQRSIAMLDEDHTVTVCRETFQHCSRHRTAAGQLFAPTLAPTEVRLTDLRVMRAAAQRSLASPSNPERLQEIPLLEDLVVQIRNDAGSEYLFGGQNLWVAAGTRAEVSVHLRATGGDGELAFHTRFRHDLDPEAFDYSFVDFQAGDELVLRYSYRSEDEMRNLQVRAGADKKGDADMSFEFLTATLTLIPPGSPRSLEVPVGLTVHRMDFFRP